MVNGDLSDFTALSNSGINKTFHLHFKNFFSFAAADFKDKEGEESTQPEH